MCLFKISGCLPFKAGRDGIFKVIETVRGCSEYLSFNEVAVSIPQSRRQRSTSTKDSVLAYQYGISLSNDGVTYGNPEYFTVLDSRCQDFLNSSDGDTVVLLKVNFHSKQRNIAFQSVIFDKT